MKYNHDEYEKFAAAANEKDYILMNDMLKAACDYFLGKADVNNKLLLWECSDEGIALVEAGVAVANSPMMACLKVIEYLSAKYNVRIFNGNTENVEDVRAFCRESVEVVFVNRQR